MFIKLNSEYCFIKVFNYLILIAFFICVYQTCSLNCEDINPYKVLGLPRNANDKQIRNAYRNLAKDWHPDKNKSPEANSKFMKITQAYEILSDPERRSLYDDYGTTSEPRQGGGHGGGYQRQSYDDFFRDFDGFEGFFSGHSGFKFSNGGREHNRKTHEDEITKKIYDEIVFPESYIKPYMIFVYTEFCFSCMSVDNVWQIFKQEIKNIGFGAGHSDASWNRELAKILGISTVPSIVGIINGRIVHFRGEYTVKNLREFARRLIPQKLVSEIIDLKSFNSTLEQTIEDNKVFALFITQSSPVSLRYKMPCFQLSNFIKCTTINSKTIDKSFEDLLHKHFRISAKDDFIKETLIILKEGIPYSALDINRVTGQTFSSTEILDFLKRHRFLDLPRLSTSSHFFDLCPSWSSDITDSAYAKKALCVILISNSATKTPPFLFDSKYKTKFIKLINNDAFLKQNAQFSYIYHNIQSDFIEKLLKSSKIQLKDNNWSFLESKVFILKRVSEKHALFNWLDIEKDSSMNELLDKLKLNLKNYLNEKQKLDYKLTIPNFYHESSQSYFGAIMDYFEDLLNYFTDQSFWERIINNSSYMMILLCTFLFIWLMMMFSAEKSNPNSVPTNKFKKEASKTGNRHTSMPHYSSNLNDSTPSSSASTPSDSSPNSSFCDHEKSSTNLHDSSFNFNINTANQFELVEMNKHNYGYLVEDSQKGYRTILLIVNKENKDYLIKLFSKVACKYLNKSYQLKFAYLNSATFAGQKWLNEIMFDRYKQLDENNDSAESCNEENDYEIYSQDQDKQIYNEKKKIKKKNSKLPNTTTKKSLEFNSDCTVLAINSKKKFYYVFNFERNENSPIHDCLGFDEDIQNRFIIELSNWLDKFTEGLDLFKKCVDDWPKLS